MPTLSRGARLRMLLVATAALVLLVYLWWRFAPSVTSGPLIRHTRSTNTYVRQFDELFPDADHFVSYYTGIYGTPIWNATVLVGGRFEVTMQAKMELNSSRSRAVSFAEPAFYVVEIVSRNLSPSGRTEVSGRSITSFGPAEWEQLVRAHGDWRAIGIDLK